MSYLKDSETPSIKYFEDQNIEVSVTLPLADKSYLGILIGPKLDKSKFTDLDKITLQILLQVLIVHTNHFYIIKRKVVDIWFE